MSSPRMEKKNCDPFELGTPMFAIDSRPASSCFRLVALISSSKNLGWAHGDVGFT